MRKQRQEKNDPEAQKQLAQVHGAFQPTDVRPGERIKAVLRRTAQNDWIAYTVWRLSPLGIEVLQQDDHRLAVNESVQVELTIGEHRSAYKGSVVATSHAARGQVLLGIRLDTSPQAQRLNDAHEQRDGARWACHKQFYPTGHAKNSARFNDKLYFRVTDISASGMRIATSMRNKYLVTGLNLQVVVQCPSVGEVSMATQVVHSQTVQASPDGPFEHLLGLRFVDPSEAALSTLGQYILQFGGSAEHLPTPAAMQKAGFCVQVVADALEFDVVRTDAEYQQVLELRSQAFQSVEGLGVTSTPEQMADIYDTRSRIVICRFRGKVVGTVRLCFHGPDDKFEEEQYITLPDNFPPRHLILEVSRAATDVEFRGTDLFLNILRYVFMLTLQSGCRYIVQSTYGKLVPIYKRVAFRETGVRFPHPVFPGEHLYLMLADCQNMIDGNVRNPLTWNLLVPEVRRLIDNNDNVHLGWFARRRLGVLSSLGPVYRFLERRHLKSRAKKSRKTSIR